MEGTNVKRGSWGSRFGILMAMAGMAVGLGNVWRFPYLVGQWGGGAFVFAYLALLFIIVIPLSIVEIGMGKGIQKGNIDTFGVALGSKKAGTLIGGAAALVYLSLNFFFLAILGTSLYYIYVSAMGLWNQAAPETIYNTFQANKTLVLILFFAVLAIVTAIVYKGVEEGIERASKILVPAVFVFFAAIIIYSFTLPNIGKGFEYYLAPDWAKLADINLWIAAAGQVLFSVGVGPGCLLVYGSLLKKTDDVTVNATTICMIDTASAVLIGFAILPLCIALGMDPTSGERLIFVVLPALFQQIPGGPLVGIVVFIAIFFAGLTSAVAQLETPVTTFSDAFGWRRPHVIAVLTLITIAAAVPALYSPELLSFWITVGADWGFIITAGIGGIAFSWIYGVKKVRENFINPTSDIQLGSWFDPLAKYISAPLMTIIIAFALYSMITG